MPLDLYAARALDAADPLSRFRDEFLLPTDADGAPHAYFAGHSLGPQPRAARAWVLEALDDWARHGVDGHFAGKHPWLPYHELLTDSTARLVGALPREVVVMNTLTVNLHLMLATFYRPRGRRTLILVESGAFPSDCHAVASQAQWHGLDPARTVVALAPRPGEAHLRDDDVVDKIGELGDQLALVLFGNCNYLTGQAFDMPSIVQAGHAAGAAVGFDLAHGAGNLDCRLHDSGADFAVWCNYKYLNAGPGGLGGVFVHERHHRADVPRLAGWWGHDKASRFQMRPEFLPIAGAEGWQLSNPPILQMASVRASMALFDAAGIGALRERGDRLTGALVEWIDALPVGRFRMLTPREPARRGSMVTLHIPDRAGDVAEQLQGMGVVVDLRRPDIVRMTPAPLYTSFQDVARAGRGLHEALT
ncbi:MAG: kynureninase [Deltaproteobacteria bacterium]|nr:kynureninase [Deltaproteobacteria bacterium]